MGLRLLIWMTVGLMAALPAHAQTPAGAPSAPAPIRMEFDAVIRQAVEKNPTVARAATNITRAEALLQQARAVTLPSAAVGVTNTTLDGARSFSGGVTTPQNQFAFTGNASMPVLAASRWAAVTQARDQIEVASVSVDEVRQQIVVAAAQAYLSVLAFKRQVDVNERALEGARAHLDYAQKRFEGGAGSRLNQLRAAQIVSSEETRLEAIRFSLRSAQEALGVLIAADGPVDTGAEPVFDAPGSMDESAWMKARPDLLTQAAVQRAAERVVKDSWRDWMPTVNASFDPAYITPRSLFQPSGTWRFTLVASQPLFDGGVRKSARRLREVSLTQTKLDLTLLEIQARSEVRIAQEAVRSRERTLATATRAAEEAAEVLRITTTAFEVGATTNLEVIDAQREARDADTAAALAKDALNRAKLELLVALGLFK